MYFTVYCSFEHKQQVLRSLRAVGRVITIRSFGVWSLSHDPHEFAFMRKDAALKETAPRLLYEIRVQETARKSLRATGRGA